MTINTGDELDSKYRILCWLGGGGFGDVYLRKTSFLAAKSLSKLLRTALPMTRPV